MRSEITRMVTDEGGGPPSPAILLGLSLPENDLISIVLSFRDQ